MALDSFSGYAVLRSPELTRELRGVSTKLTLSDDGADYAKRIRALDAGTVDLAVFTVDSLLTASAELGRFPGTIVLVVDETRGADAIVAKPGGPRSLEELNRPDARFVLTPASPSEFLGRVVRAHFRLDQLGEDWVVPADGAEAVLAEYRRAPDSDRRAYVLWEPHVSMAEAEGARRLLDSSKLKGLIVDVLVARRQFLLDQPDRVREFLAAYLRAARALGARPDGFQRMVQDDSVAAGSPLEPGQAAALSRGIHWKNLKENYAHFGLLKGRDARGVPYLEDVVTNVTQVLLRTGALAEDPLDGEGGKLFYDKPLGALRASGFDPAGIPGVSAPTGARLDDVRGEEALATLDEAQWQALVPVGDVDVAPLSFGRGGARLNVSSRRELKRLANTLAAWPGYYVVVTGHARAEGDPAANRQLALDRAQAAADHLVDLGVPRPRMRVVAAVPAGEGGRAQSVRFQLGRRP